MSTVHPDATTETPEMMVRTTAPGFHELVEDPSAVKTW
jgi:hypothetical protein